MLETSDSRPHARRDRRIRARNSKESISARRAALLCATALISTTSTSAFAQVTIDGGATETVDPVNGGTQPSPWNIAGDLRVGETGEGALSILQGGQVTATSLGLGLPSDGRINVLGGSSLTVNGNMNLRNGTMEISSSSVVSQTATLANNGGDVSLVTVGGANANWTNTGATLVVGDEGTGEVRVFQDASVDSNGVVVGAFTTGAGDFGRIWLTNNGEWRNTGDMTVGSLGSAIIDVEGGSTMNTSGITNVALNSGSSGRITITDSEWINGGLFNVGGANGSSGVVAVSGATASLTANDDFIIAPASGGSGTVTVENGATLDVSTASTTLVVGQFGDGRLIVRNGGAVNVEELDIGSNNVGGTNNNGRGVVEVDGAGSSLTSSNGVLIGNGSATGVLVIRNGGDVSVRGRDFVMGSCGNCTGELTVDGAGSGLSVTQNFRTPSGNTIVTVLNGGQIGTSRDIEFSTATGNTDITVDGAGSIIATPQFMMIAADGTADMTLSNGGEARASQSVNVGFSARSVGAVAIGGEGSVLFGDAGVIAGNSGDGALTVFNGGLIDAGASERVSLGVQSGSTGVLNVGAAAGDAAQGAGMIDATLIALGDGESSVVFNHTDTDYVFASNVNSDRTNTSPGDSDHLIDVYSGVTTMTGTWDIDGATTLHGGRLNVNGEIVGDFNVLGGTVGGSGTLQALSLPSGAALSPGASIGTLTIVNDLGFGDGSSLEIEVNEAGASDLVDVGGAVTIGNDVGLEVLPENGTDDGSTYNESTEYTFLQATGGITGEFATVTENFAFLDAEVTIENGEAVLTLTRAANPDNGGGNGVIEFEDVAVSPNQRSIARSLEALGSGSELYDVVVGLSEAQARTAFDQLSGEIHASALASVMQDSRIIREAAVDRLRSAGDGQGFALWGSAYGSWGAWDESSDNTAAELDRSTAGFLLGADFPLLNTLRVGAMLGVAGGDIEVESRGSEADLNAFHFGAYADWNVFKAMTIRAGLLNSWNDLETERAVDIRGFNSFSDRLTAEYNANIFQLFAEAAYAFDLGRFNVEPYAGLAYASLDADEVTERGGSARLAAAEYDMETTFSTIGMRADYAFEMFGANAALEGGLAWRHAFDDTLPRQTFGFVGATGGQTFTTEGVPLAEDAAVIDLGLRLPLAKRLGAKLGYNGEFGDGVSDHGVRANLSFAF